MNDSNTPNNNRSNLTALIATGVAALLAGVLITILITGGDDDDDNEPVPTTPVAQQTAPPAETVDPDDLDDQVPANTGNNNGGNGNNANNQAPIVDSDDQPISAADQKRVSNAAVQIAGGGTVTDLDRSDDPGEAWEVEVTQSNGAEIDIALDANLNRVQNTSYDD